MWLIVGLGNPGQKYRGSRHNLGFEVIDRLAARAGIKVGRKAHQAILGRGRWAGSDVALAKPQTYMNLSGTSVATMLRHWRLKPDRLVVAHDDLDLPVGRLKLTSGGGPGGHKGIRSIIEHVGSPDFARVKLGIGRPTIPRMTVERFVLTRFSPEERPTQDQTVERALEAIERLLTDGLAKAQSEFNRHPSPE